jgi:two-component system NtrC family sensor kinase
MSKHTLLIVDDETNVLKSLKRLLIDTDYRILTAESGDEAMKVLDNNEVHVVISDYRMPGMNGVELLSKIKEKYPDTIRLILSGYADAVAIVEAINEGQVYRFITKPWNDQELLTTILRTFEQYDLQQENDKLYSELQARNKELQDLAKSLEEKIFQRTKDLEIRNRALMMARNILNYLPAGVIGIDVSETIVYMNESLKDYLAVDNLSLGLSARDFLSDDIYGTSRKALEDRQIKWCYIGEKNEITSIWSPLPGHGGVIGFFVYSDSAMYENSRTGEFARMGVINDK